ncbi:transporter substrate-binding domain-containing protein [Anaerosacchariphilus sp. NSJ-68]|uniref:Transporter substrate-binding domain-containing protein n=2 Tax=Lachnospiraceae TaxID=186803 RepID=A0A923LD60_9FIRM|nr:MULTISPECIES: transporter substrate-binding domain-containing protein [Lachnospiraceae]MBC5660166.1 transporter substrate-binding domain-containing protein [Anaerosacchariphilus hominis]MBC5699281.1 transporter substrate-binding domain-containing protein [Roseburia difficilis]
MKKLLALALVASMTLGLAACGSSDKGADTAAETETKTEDTADTADTTASDKTWVIAMDTVFRPFEYTDENGDFVGIDVDIIKAVAADQGFKIDIQSLGWDAAVTAVQAGQADALLAGASITDERKANGWIFSDSYYDSYQVFATKTGSGIETLEDLKGKTVAVKNATAGAQYAESLKDEYGFKVDTYEDSPTMYQAVVLGQADACVEDKPIMADSIKSGNLDLVIAESTASDVAPYGLAIMNEKNQEFLDMFNAGLKEIKDNGTYDEILDKYLGN